MYTKVGLFVCIFQFSKVIHTIATAKIIKVQASAGSVNKYFIHYDGWSRRFDIWVDESQIAKLNDEKKIAAILAGPMKAGSAAKGVV